jgi:hypothetical protein
MYGERQETGPLPDSYLVNNLLWDTANSYFDGRHDHLLPRIGFYIGMLHGSILSPQTEELRPDATSLATFQNQEAARGYRVGREYYFCEASPKETRITDESLIERLRELARESLEFCDEESTWYYSIGCLLGELSGQLFPASLAERQQWETERQKWLEDCS